MHTKRWLLLAGFIVFVVGAGSLIGIFTAPGQWYDALDKPPFNPPNWVFGPVWTLLYILIAVAGWRMWLKAADSVAMKAWIAQLVLNWIWSPVFFSLQLLWPAFLIIIAMFATILAFIVTARRHDSVASWLMTPYLAWVGFAAVLNGSVAWLN